ncbi:VOC family protein [Bacillus sp. DTU_2020_1000418_1_SI_GHA_SEK_038]|uniref:VOC family protein n=1 Tax=Bacillus sp. DTU_2020_1000418_1_SI_GHA_SEK_038 TaxID=3077585 RepID=UPI0028EF8B60|nr:VOC family protein [Bacillus sp. DTU_2020_1000418_1_SI_GHA_SEK_038]WNS75929.1 VOC family protein [Bacillus sp. DTU_2020_1000418_1_SI_GHA_SEK_038]
MKGQATPYLTFNGNAREALEYYKEVFEGEILNLQTFGDADYPTPPEADNRIMHAQFRKDDLFFMASDSFSDGDVQIGNNISLVLEFESEDEIQRVYDRLSNKGTVLMELQDTFWGAKYAKVKDAFGTVWDLNMTKA